MDEGYSQDASWDDEAEEDSDDKNVSSFSIMQHWDCVKGREHGECTAAEARGAQGEAHFSN